MGSRRRYFNKYTSLWLRSGDHALLGIRPTIFQTLVRWRGVVTAGKDIDRVARLHIENPAMPTFYHIFSTGGFIHAGTMWRWMDEVEDVMLRRDLLEDVAGIILDSGPAVITEDIAARAFTAAVTGNQADAVDIDKGVLGPAARSFFRFWLQRSSVAMRTEEVYEAWYNRAPKCPQLYLYSDADPVAPPQGVEEYMKVQESRGVRVSGHKWPDSGHCEHYRKYPQDYTFQVSQFVAQALKDW